MYSTQQDSNQGDDKNQNLLQPQTSQHENWKILTTEDKDHSEASVTRFDAPEFNTHRDDGSKSLDGAGAQCNVRNNVLGKACFQEDPIGVVPDLKETNTSIETVSYRQVNNRGLLVRFDVIFKELNGKMVLMYCI